MEREQTGADETSSLRRGIREVVALSGLSAVWKGHGPQQIAESLAEVLLHTLYLDFAYIRLNDQTDQGTFEAGHTDLGSAASDRIQKINGVLAPWLKSTNTSLSAVASLPDPFGTGTVRVVLTPIGYDAPGGILVAGSRRMDFPTPIENVLLSVGANQAAITLQHLRAEEALRQSQERYRVLTEASPHMTWTMRPDGIFDFVSRSWLEGIGLTLEEVNRDGWAKVVHPGDYQRVLDEFAGAWTRGEAHSVEFRLRHSDGRYRWVIGRTVPIKDDLGAVVQWIGTTTDIHEHKQAEEIRARLATIVESSDDAVVSKSLDGIIATWNSGAQRIFGYSAEEAIGSPITMLIPPERQQEEQEILQRLRRGERVDHIETVRLTKDGRRRDMSITISPLHDANGAVIGASKVARDITERRQGERERAELLAREHALRTQAEAANRAKDDFLATLSHELRTPLNAILGWIQTLDSGKAKKETLVRALRAIEQSAHAQAKLIEDLLNASDIVAGRLRLDVKPISARAVIDDAIESLRPALAAKEHEFAVQFDTAADSIMGDANRLRQIVWNLLANAVKFTPSGGKIRLALTRHDSDVAITVEDTGEGISAEFLPYAFDRFRQADASSKRRHGGLGLGLAIVRHLVELHGGTVTAESAGKGQGARFTVRLPVRAPKQVAEAEQMKPTEKTERAGTTGAIPRRRRLDGFCILSIDDDANTREMLQEALERAGARVISAASAPEALAALKLSRPDVLVSDIGLPGKDGYDLLRSVRALPAEAGGATPAIALTGYAGKSDRLATEQAGYQAFASKPVNLAELIASIIRVTSD